MDRGRHTDDAGYISPSLRKVGRLKSSDKRSGKKKLSSKGGEKKLGSPEVFAYLMDHYIHVSEIEMLEDVHSDEKKRLLIEQDEELKHLLELHEEEIEDLDKKQSKELRDLIRKNEEESLSTTSTEEQLISRSRFGSPRALSSPKGKRKSARGKRRASSMEGTDSEKQGGITIYLTNRKYG